MIVRARPGERAVLRGLNGIDVPPFGDGNENASPILAVEVEEEGRLRGNFVRRKIRIRGAIERGPSLRAPDGEIDGRVGLKELKDGDALVFGARAARIARLNRVDGNRASQRERLLNSDAQDRFAPFEIRRLHANRRESLFAGPQGREEGRAKGSEIRRRVKGGANVNARRSVGIGRRLRRAQVDGASPLERKERKPRIEDQINFSGNSLARLEVKTRRRFDAHECDFIRRRLSKTDLPDGGICGGLSINRQLRRRSPVEEDAPPALIAALLPFVLRQGEDDRAGRVDSHRGVDAQDQFGGEDGTEVEIEGRSVGRFRFSAQRPVEDAFARFGVRKIGQPVGIGREEIEGVFLLVVGIGDGEGEIGERRRVKVGPLAVLQRDGVRLETRDSRE